VAIADHPFTLGQRGFDHRLNQLNARRVEHQHFGFVSDNFVANGFDIQHQAAQFSASCVPPGSRVNTMSATPSDFSVSTTTLRAVVLPAPSSPSMTMYLLRIFSLSAFR
jgi:hypothetical protein